MFPIKKRLKYLVWVVVLAALVLLIRSRLDRGGAAPTPAPTGTPAAVSLQTSAPLPTAAQSYFPCTEPLSRDPAEVSAERDWKALLAYPTMEEIENCNSLALARSPQIGCWVSGDGVDSFTAYSVEFRADHVPAGTYCCVGQFALDCSALTDAGCAVRQDYEGVSLYAGFQRQGDGSLNAICSVWDLFVTDASGVERTVRAEQTYPTDKRAFSGEGTGVQCLVPFGWQTGRWYRMELLCGTSPDTGNTTLSQWVTDTQTLERTLLCVYDLGLPDLHLRGSACLFLEDYLTEFSGDVRSMECRALNVTAPDGRVLPLTRAHALSFADHPGSWRCGADGGVLYFITSGVEGLDGALQGSVEFSLY